MMSRPTLPPELREAAQRARAIMVEITGSADLKDRCMPASFLLRELARARGHAVDVLGGGAVVRASRDWWRNLKGHAWCQYGDAYIDLTATQFWREVSGVYVVPAPHRRYTYIAKQRNDALWATAREVQAAQGTLRAAMAVALASGDLGASPDLAPAFAKGARVELLVEHTHYPQQRHAGDHPPPVTIPAGSHGSLQIGEAGTAAVVAFDAHPSVMCWCDPRALVPSASVRPPTPRVAVSHVWMMTP